MPDNIKKAVIFDLDGTLLDTLQDLTDAVNYLLQTHGFPKRSAREIRNFLGNGAEELVRLALPEEVAQETLKEYLAEYKAYYNAHSKIKTRPYGGVMELLEILKSKGIGTAIVTNKPDLVAGQLAEEYFGKLIDQTLGDREGIRRKPDAEPVRWMMERLECHKAIYVGDSEVDILTARNAGIPCISLTWGFRDREQLVDCGAAIFADDAEELKRQIFALLEVEDV